MISEQPGKVTFIEAHKDFFKGFLDFKGRTTRAGYWWTVPLQFIFRNICRYQFSYWPLSNSHYFISVNSDPALRSVS